MVEVVTGDGSIEFPGANVVEREYGPQGFMGLKILARKATYETALDVGYVSAEAKPLSWVIRNEVAEK